MSKVLLALGLGALLLAGCGSTQKPEDVVFTMRSGYDATVLAPAANYAHLDTCPKSAPICKDPAVVLELQKADAAAKAALDSAESLVRNHPNIDASFAIAGARALIDAAARIIAIYGVH